jgi:hypothetical protein
MVGGFALLGALIFFLLRRPKQNYNAPIDNSSIDGPPPSYPEKQILDDEKNQEAQSGNTFYETHPSPALRYSEKDGEDGFDGPVGGRTAIGH